MSTSIKSEGKWDTSWRAGWPAEWHSFVPSVLVGSKMLRGCARTRWGWWGTRPVLPGRGATMWPQHLWLRACEEGLSSVAESRLEGHGCSGASPPLPTVCPACHLPMTAAHHLPVRWPVSSPPSASLPNGFLLSFIGLTQAWHSFATH